MKTFLIIILIAILTSCVSSKNADGSLTPKEQARELKKAQKEAELKTQFDSLMRVVDSKRFVLEANFISNQRGRRIYVSSNLNFVKIDSTEAILQIGSLTGYGYNGVGGVTAEGLISSWKVNKNDKKKSCHIEFNVVTSIGVFNVDIIAYANSNAIATISGLRPGRLQYDGKIIPLEASTIFKGTTTR